MDPSPREFNEQLRNGYVSQEAFRKLWDAECYGNVSSLGVLKSWLQDLEVPLKAGKRIEIEGDRFISSSAELLQWIKETFPDAYSCFYQDRDFSLVHENKKPNQSTTDNSGASPLRV